MDKFARRRLFAAVTTVTAMFAGALVAPGAHATPSQVPAGRDRLPDLMAGYDRSAHGRFALEALADRLPEAARRNGMTTEHLRQILSHDPAAWLDRDARLLYQDPARTEGATSGPVAPAAEAASLDQTFLLHSKPGSQRTIYLDFTGHNVSGTVWNTQHGLAAGTQPAWSLNADPATFDPTESATVQSVWRRVAEDYAPFDVDVTTQEPTSDGVLTRTDAADPIFGVRALITPSNNAANKLCHASCGGIAYNNVFDSSDSTYFQPAWIFPQNLANDAKSIAEAVSHEVGHTLGLDHDGTSSTGYYGGHATWAPIMGVGYSRPITQWSKGDYKGANNHQDDLSVIASNGLPVRADEASSDASPATAPPTGSAYITSDADRDVYTLGICSGPLTLAAAPAAQSPNLDLRLSLLDVTGRAVGVGNPTSRAGTPSRDVATGMDATVSRTAAGNWYFAAVEGVGNGSPSKGYDGYASVGAYNLRVDGNCQTPSNQLPSAPQTVQASTGGGSATVAWSAPASTGGSTITGYVVTRGDEPPVVVGAQRMDYTYTDLKPGATDNIAVQAVNSTGEGAPAAVVVKVPATKPGPARIRSASSGARGGKVTAVARWRAPRSDGGANVNGYRVYGYRLNDRGSVVQTVTSSVRSASARSWQPTLRKGRWKFAVRARNPIGWGKVSARSNTVTAR